MSALLFLLGLCIGLCIMFAEIRYENRRLAAMARKIRERNG